MRPARYLAAALLVALVYACASVAAGPKGPEPPRRQLVVSNHGIDKLAVYLETAGSAGVRIGTVMPGETRAVRLPDWFQSGALLVAETQRGRREFAVRFDPGSVACWDWRLPLAGSAGAYFPVPCAYRQVAPDSPPLLPGEMRVVLTEHTLGFATCGVRPVAWVQEGMDSLLTLIVRAHQRNHLEQMARWPSCAAHWAWAAERPENRMEMEARAHCAGAEESVRIGRSSTLQAAVWEQAGWFRHYYRLSHEAAVRAIAEFCPFTPA